MDAPSESSSHSETPSPTLKTLEDQPVVEQDLRSPTQDPFDIQAPEEEAPNQIEENELNNDEDIFKNESKAPVQKDFALAAAQRNRRKLLELRSHSNSIKTSQALAESSNPPEPEDQAEKPVESHSRVRLPPLNHHRRVPSVEIPQVNSCEVSREVPQHNVSQEGRQSQLEEFGSDNQSDMQQDEYKRNFYSHVIAKSRPQSSSLFKNASQVVKKNAVAPALMINNSMPLRTPSPHKSINIKDSMVPPGSFVSETKKSRFGRENEDTVQTGFQKLEAMNGIVLKQKFDVFKNEKGWVPPLRTYVHDYDLTENETGAKMFQANEISSYCAQQCLSNYCRPFSVAINTCNPGESPDDHKAFLMLERECNCSCLWLSRPTIAVRYVEDGRDIILGSIKDAFTWCGGIKLEVLDKNGALRYTVQGDCCQWGLFCNCKCKSCQEVSFLVKSEARESSLEIVKKNTSWSPVEFPGADRFKFGFTHEVSAEDKALLLSAVLFLEARHFDGDP